MTSTLALGVASGTGRAQVVSCCPVIELRQYVMQPGKRDVLIDMFDRIFCDAQEAAGSTILGQFRDPERPDYFIWLRGFSDLASRPIALNTFYTSALWQKHRDAANATMVDVSDVLLMRPLDGAGAEVGKRPEGEGASGIVEITVYPFNPGVETSVIASFNREIEAALEAAGAHTRGRFVSEKSANNYPRLPIRENENVLVRIASFATPDACDKHRAELARSAKWQALWKSLRARLKAEPQVMRLTPTTRSLLHG